MVDPVEVVRKPANGTENGLPMAVVDRAKVVGPPANRFRVLKRFWPILFIPPLVMTGGFIGLYFQPPGLQKLMAILRLEPGGGTRSPIAVPVEKAPAVTKATVAQTSATVAGLGKLVPQGDVIVVAPPFGAGDARIASLKVKEGDALEAGAVIAILDNEPTLAAALEAARANVGVRQAAIAQTRASVRASLDEAQASVTRAESVLANAQLDFDRVDQLRKKGFAADASFDQKRALREQAARDVERARATLSRYTATDIDAQPDVAVAKTNLAAAEAELARTRRDMDKAIVRAPIAGTVLSTHANPGEKPGQAGIANIANLDRMTAEVEVYQTQIGAVAVGDRVEVSADALPGRLKGVVTRIGLEVGRQSVIDATPAANTDARVVKVYVLLDPEASAIARRYTNLQVTARISVGAGK